MRIWPCTGTEIDDDVFDDAIWPYLKNRKAYYVICKECGCSSAIDWILGKKTSDIKVPCQKCGGADWEDHLTPAGRKIEIMVQKAGGK
jgi:uncharacterized Zn finger protein